MSLRYLLLLQRDVPKAAKFYHEGLGFPIKVLTDNWAELQCGAATIALKAADRWAGGGQTCSLQDLAVQHLPIWSAPHHARALLRHASNPCPHLPPAVSRCALLGTRPSSHWTWKTCRPP